MRRASVGLLSNPWIASTFTYWMYFTNLTTATGTVRDYQAVAGGRVTMPCNITAPSTEDVVTLVLWYKGDVKVPIYTLDARKGPIEKSRHFPSSKLGRRVHFDLLVKTPGLTIDPVRPEDEGTYKCRVEYKRYRTLSYTYNLRVIVPPREVIVMDEHGQRLDETIGPVDEGSNVTLVCEAEGGSPSPSVTWWRDSVLLDDTYYITTQGYVRNDIMLPRLRRGDLLAVFSCHASNNNLTVPVTNSVTLDLNLKPLDVRITTPIHPLSAGKRIMLECESTGSRPGALMTWWKGREKIQSGHEVISDNGNLTLSTLAFLPSDEDNGKKMTCTAENPSLPNSLMDDSRVIAVHYVPELRLALGASIQHTAIKEGSDVYFDCNIRANPWVTDVSWRFQDKILYSNTSAGIIVSNQSLVLQRVQKEHRGKYQCVASNTEGEGRSEEVHLGVQFAPVCKTPAGSVFGVAKYETINITCELEADPPDITFRWALNNTVESIDIRDYVKELTTSTVSYTPRSMLGYGILLCSGTNNIGKQRDPCVYRVVPVGPPETLRNCAVSNQTTDSLVVQCEPGYDGGLKQSFHLEVYSSDDENLHANLTVLDYPLFTVQELLTGTPFILVLYAANSKGKSNSVALMATTLLPAERRTAEEETPGVSPMMGVLIGTVAALVILSIVIVIIVKVQTRSDKKDPEDIKQEKCEIPLQNYKDESVDSNIESPDIIPADTQVYAADTKGIHLECSRRVNEEMYQLLKQKQGNYEGLIGIPDQTHPEVIEDISYTELGVPGFHKRSIPMHMEPPSEYSDYHTQRRGRTQVLPPLVGEPIEKLNTTELPLINNMQQNTRDSIRGDRIVATTPL